MEHRKYPPIASGLTMLAILRTAATRHTEERHMKNNKRYQSIFFISLLFLGLNFIAPLWVQGQQEQNIKSYRPPAPRQSKKDFDYRREISGLEGGIKPTTTFAAYCAARDEDLSICEHANTPSACRKKTGAILEQKYLAQGNCEKIKNNVLKEICKDINSRDCSSLQDNEKDVCQGYITEDLNLLEKGMHAYDVDTLRQKYPTTGAVASERMATYAGYKYYNSKMACEKFAKGLPIKKAFLCDALFATDNSEEVFNTLAHDIALFLYAKNHNKPDLCNEIKNKIYKESCRNKKVEMVNWWSEDKKEQTP